jgi:3-dehydroquinate synthase
MDIDLGSFVYNAQHASLANYLHNKHVIIVADQRSNGFCLHTASESLLALRSATCIVIPAGEQSKSIEIAEYIIAQLAALHANKQTVIVSLGGGMVTDITAFVASVYMRGMPLVHIPTTLLAMVDAAIGGKTALNFGGIKNLMGTVYFPEFIWFNTDFLRTLPYRELACGVAEQIKHAMITSDKLWQNCLQHQSLQDFVQDIASSHQIKKDLVLKDAFDADARQQLNWGHSIGHAIEAATSTTAHPLLHGEAVMLGIYAELLISEELQQCDPAIRESFALLLHRHFPLVKISAQVQAKDILQKLSFDKKNTSHINMSLLQAIGNCTIGIKVPEDMALKAIQKTMNYAR